MLLEETKKITYENYSEAKIGKLYFVFEKDSKNNCFDIGRLLEIDPADSRQSFKLKFICLDGDGSYWVDNDNVFLYPVEIDISKVFSNIQQKEKLEIIKKLRESKKISIFSLLEEFLPLE